MSYNAPLRDRVAYWLARAALSIATPEYKAFIRVPWQRGIESVLRELSEGQLDA